MNGATPIGTVGYAKVGEYSLGEDGILRWVRHLDSGQTVNSIPPLIHQFDRYPEMITAFEKLYGDY
jgi:hypothetical protein